MKKTKSLYKIYSRNRINLFQPKKIKWQSSKNNKKKIYLTIIILISIITYFVITKSIEPIFETIVLNEAQGIATEIVSNGSSKAMENFKYGDIFTIEKDNDRKYTNDKCRYYYNRPNNI